MTLTQAPPHLFERFCSDVALSDRNLRAARRCCRAVADRPRSAHRWQEHTSKTLDDALKSCAISSWPQGYRRRRDAWLLVLTWGLGMSRREALGVRGPDIRIEAAGAGPDPLQVVILVQGVAHRWVRNAVASTDPFRCWGCAMVRWWQCRAAEYHWSRAAVHQCLRDQHAAAGDHVCESGLAADTLSQLPEWITLAPGLDRHGWISTGHEFSRPGSDEVRQVSMTPRAMTALLAGYAGGGFSQNTERENDQPPSGLISQKAQPVTSGSPLEDDSAVLLDKLEAACRAADLANERMSALLAGTNGQPQP